MKPSPIAKKRRIVNSDVKLRPSGPQNESNCGSVNPINNQADSPVARDEKAAAQNPNLLTPRINRDDPDKLHRFRSKRWRRTGADNLALLGANVAESMR